MADGAGSPEHAVLVQLRLILRLRGFQAQERACVPSLEPSQTRR